MNKLGFYLTLIFTVLYLSACTIVPWGSHANREMTEESTGEPEAGAIVSGGGDPVTRASVAVPWRIDHECRNQATLENIGACEHNDEDFIAIAISGGGTRSAIFSAAVLLELQRYGLLKNVDVITCVSGGCLTAAYYALSCAQADGSSCLPTATGTRRPHWPAEPGDPSWEQDQDQLYELLARNYKWRWIGNWLWPDNVVRYWFTYYDRTDIMAETLSDNLYDTSLIGGKPFRFKDLNLRRPNLLIGATNGAALDENALPFLFSVEQFYAIGSDLREYKIGNAVTASATFPGAFQYVTLKNYAVTQTPAASSPRHQGDVTADSFDEPARLEPYPEGAFLHLFDGGTYDNLGLKAVTTAIENSRVAQQDGARVLVISIDAYQPFHGKDDKDPETRDNVDYLVDTNFLDAFDTLLTSVRSLLVADVDKGLDLKGDRHNFVHITFTDLTKKTFTDEKKAAENKQLVDVMKSVDTDFSIESYQTDCLILAAQILVQDKMVKLGNDPHFKDLVSMPENGSRRECNPPKGRKL